MKKLIYFLFILCMIISQKAVTHASISQTGVLNLCYVDSIADLDLDDYEDYLNYLDDDLDDDLDDISTDYSSETDIQQNNSIVLIFIIILVIYLIQGCIFGFATQAIIKNKGHQENWFWWGFFFGFIALLVALSKPQLHNTTTSEQTASTEISNEEIGNQTPKEDGWECAFCHRKNDKVVTTCICGKSHDDTEAVENRIMKEGGWECAFCHKKNDKVVTTCTCGKTRDDTNEKIRSEEKKRTEQQQPTVNHLEINTIELLEKYKQLLDSGVITQEEFDAKKKQLLDN